jgi:hypothetical protein
VFEKLSIRYGSRLICVLLQDVRCQDTTTVQVQIDAYVDMIFQVMVSVLLPEQLPLDLALDHGSPLLWRNSRFRICGR